MSELVKRISQTPFFLMASLPKNDPEMAKAAEAMGAMAIKVHLNVEHPASKTHFGSFSEENISIEKIVKSVKIPVGVVPGGEQFASQDELLRMADMGVDFFDAFARYLPVFLFEMPGIGKMVALGEEYSLPKIGEFHDLGAQIIEATIFNPKVYGTPLFFSDLAAYRTIVKQTTLPVLVPTQKKIRPEEVSLLYQAGCKGIVIGAVVTGNTLESLSLSVRQFSQEIRDIY